MWLSGVRSRADVCDSPRGCSRFGSKGFYTVRLQEARTGLRASCTSAEGFVGSTILVAHANSTTHISASVYAHVLVRCVGIRADNDYNACACCVTWFCRLKGRNVTFIYHSSSVYLQHYWVDMHYFKPFMGMECLEEPTKHGNVPNQRHPDGSCRSKF